MDIECEKHTHAHVRNISRSTYYSNSQNKNMKHQAHVQRYFKWIFIMHFTIFPHPSGFPNPKTIAPGRRPPWDTRRRADAVALGALVAGCPRWLPPGRRPRGGLRWSRNFASEVKCYSGWRWLKVVKVGQNIEKWWKMVKLMLNLWILGIGSLNSIFWRLAGGKTLISQLVGLNEAQKRGETWGSVYAGRKKIHGG